MTLGFRVGWGGATANWTKGVSRNMRAPVDQATDAAVACKKRERGDHRAVRQSPRQLRDDGRGHQLASLGVPREALAAHR